MNRTLHMVEKAMEATQGAIRQKEEQTILKTAKDFKELILNNDYQMIAEYVYANDDLTDDMALAAVSICRRRFKRNDIVLMIPLDEDVEGERGIVFTKDKLYCWEEDEEYKGEIAYDDIEDVTYTDDTITIIRKSGDEITIYCGIGFIEHKRRMYNYLMDIKEYAESSND